jgi:Tir chaperone protein (CesT) family
LTDFAIVRLLGIIPVRQCGWTFAIQLIAMTPQELPNSLATLFGDALHTLAPGSYQVETDGFRMLVLLSEDQAWLRVLMPIAPAAEAAPFWEELLEANFAQTLEIRYGMNQGLLWGIYQHSLAGLTTDDLTMALHRLIELHQLGIEQVFGSFAEKRVREIIKAAKQQGQSLDATLKALDRFYEEGVMGDVASSAAERNQTMAAWRHQLERLWDEVEP